MKVLALLKIVKEGDDILRKKSKPVDTITDKIKTLIGDMKDTLIESGGVGLAAPQVGILRRIFIIDVGDENGGHKIIEFINPKIISEQGTQDGIEGCLSIPGKYGNVIRPMTVTVTATNSDGKEFSYTGTEIFGRCLCHEYDHLDGVLYIDKAYEIFDSEDVEE